MTSLMLIALRLVHRSALASRICHHHSVTFPITSTPLKCNVRSQTRVSASSATHLEHTPCPTCGKTITDTMTMSRINDSFSGPQSGSPLVVPPGPPAAAAFGSGMSAVEETRLLKLQVQDVARACNAAARGDLSQKITVSVQGVVMVRASIHASLFNGSTAARKRSKVSSSTYSMCLMPIG